MNISGFPIVSAKEFFNNKFRKKKAKTIQWEIMDIRELLNGKY
jgi:hypothetical protein